MRIKPISIWKNGQEFQAKNFIISINGDNCDTMAVIAYQLFTDGAGGMLGEMIASGQLVIQGEEYQVWDSDPSANAWIYNWALQQLNLTESDEPIPTTTSSTTTETPASTTSTSTTTSTTTTKA